MNTDEGKVLMLRFMETGDKSACRQLFNLYKVPLWRFLMRMCGFEADADDLSQRVWLRIIEVAERNSYNAHKTSTFRTYLFTIARNMFIDETRALRNKSRHEGMSSKNELSDFNTVSMESRMDKHQSNQRLLSAMNQLPTKQREVLAMWAEGFGFDEIGSIVDVPRNTVIGRKRYGIEKLRLLMDDKLKREVKN